MANAMHDAYVRARRTWRGLVGFTAMTCAVAAQGCIDKDDAKKMIEALQSSGWRFYVFVGDTGCRLMCAWDTTEAVVDAFAADVHAALERVS